MRKVLAALLIAVAGIGALGLFVTRPITVDASTYEGISGNAENGERVFTAAGCASCHHAPEAEDDAKLVLTGGQRFETGFGTFVAPNISPDPVSGIGDWTLEQFASAVTRGVAPGGQHLYPAFPYSAYIHMTPQDVTDLWAYLGTLPEASQESLPHEVGFPFNIRRGLGLWKTLFVSDDWVMAEADDAALARGRYLVEALAHCGECHTPRNALGALKQDAWLSGAPNPNGKGNIPALTPDELDWSQTDIAYYLETGFTPEFDSVGGHMVEVVENFSQLPESDRAAVAAYLKALPDPGAD